MLDMPIVIAPARSVLDRSVCGPDRPADCAGVRVPGQSRPTEKTPRCPDRAGRRYRGLVGDLVGLGRQPARLLLGNPR